MTRQNQSQTPVAARAKRPTTPKRPKLNAAAALGDALDDSTGGIGGAVVVSAEDVEDSINLNRLRASDIELAKMAAEVVPVDLAQAALRMLVGAVVNELHTLGNNLGPQLARIKVARQVPRPHQ